MPSLSYHTVGSNNLEQAKAFYDELLGSINWKGTYDHPSGGRMYTDGNTLFAVLGPYDGNPSTVGNGSMCGFKFDTIEEVIEFHAKAMRLGATNEGDVSEHLPGGYFGYFRDLDGNKFCVYKFG